jgi:hypothetical protein
MTTIQQVERPTTTEKDKTGIFTLTPTKNQFYLCQGAKL